MKRITTEMMAAGLGIPVQALRIGLQRNAFDFGIAMQQRGKQYTYVIYPEVAKKYVPEKIYKEWGIEA